MDIIFSASIIAAFLAGMVALFAPCCITVHLPAYLGSAFREKKRILKMSFVFFAGIAAVLVPIGLGAAGLAQFFRDFHNQLYFFGGLLMLALGAMAVLGKGLSFLPMGKAPKNGGASHAKSVFTLGLFSGAATSCCAPVLAGAVTLAVVSGAFWKALAVTFAYVLGMTFPLFAAAYFYDRFSLEKSRVIRGKLLNMNFGTRTFAVHSTNLLAGAIFAIMGGILLWLAISGNAFWSPALQAKIGNALNLWSQKAFVFLSAAPDIFWAVLIGGIFLFFALRARKS